MMEISGQDQDRARRYEVALGYLKGSGMTVLDVDWKNPEGMLAIVADDRSTLVVVILQGTGSVYEVPKSTLKRQRRMAVAWMHAHGTRRERIRVDVVSVHLLPMGQSNLEHARSVDGDLY